MVAELRNAIVSMFCCQTSVASVSVPAYLMFNKAVRDESHIADLDFTDKLQFRVDYSEDGNTPLLAAGDEKWKVIDGFVRDLIDARLAI